MKTTMNYTQEQLEAMNKKDLVKVGTSLGIKKAKTYPKDQLLEECITKIQPVEKKSVKRDNTEGKIKVLENMISAAKWQREEIINYAMNVFPNSSPSTFATYISDAKKPDYLKDEKKRKWNKFGRLVEEVKRGDKKVVKFVEDEGYSMGEEEREALTIN